mmetsp:Transcript_45377/g.104722  ORF Transcript_45377/g.104722 Transcript_45377/m.104722 type:complete len:817 (-) Transcript_45377:370-2820(-)
MDLESELAAFLGTERSLVYSSAVATVSSILPAFAKRGDTVFVDDGAHANARIRNGVELTRSRVRVYPRGDVAALKELLLEQEALDARLPAANVGRRLIVAEGVCAATGDIAPLPALLELRDAHGAYLFVDETHSLGVLGAHGKGVAEHYRIPPSAIDAIMGSLEHALGSVGGFCAGSSQVIRQQRLFATGFIFSASLPAYCAAVASEALCALIAEPERAAGARAASRMLRLELERSGVVQARALVLSGGEGGVLHVRAPAAGPDAASQRAALAAVGARMLSGFHMAITVLPVELAAPAEAAGGRGPSRQRAGSVGVDARVRGAPLPSIRLTPAGCLTGAELQSAAQALVSALLEVLPAPPPGSPLCLKPPTLRANGAAVGVPLELPPSLKVGGSSDGGDSIASDADIAIAPSPAAAAAVKPRVGAKGELAPLLPVVDTPLGLALGYLRRKAHAYLARQAEWGVANIVVPAQRYCRSTGVTRLFFVMSLLGSEAFYVAALPSLIWAEAGEGASARASLARTLVLFFAASVVVGNVLKVLLSLPRPLLAPLAGAAAMPPADEGWNRDYAWPSIAAMNAIGLPFFLLRHRFAGNYLWAQDDPLTTVAYYAVAFLWAAGICGSRLVAGAASPADVQGGMMIGALLVRLGLPWHEALADWLGEGSSTVLGVSPEIALPLLAVCVLLLHPVTPGDERGAYSVTNSAKALGFAAAFALGSRARILQVGSESGSAFAARTAFSACAYSYHGVGGLLLMAAILALTHRARRAAVRSAQRALGLAGKVGACGVEYYLLGLLVALWVPRALDAGAYVGHIGQHLLFQ